jgi:hypothetical protein
LISNKYIYGGSLKWVPQIDDLFIIENPDKMDDFGVPLF